MQFLETLKIIAQVMEILALFALLGFVVHQLKAGSGARLTGTLTAIASVLTVLIPILLTVYGV